ncbi:MAG TPA: hypothetical protein VG498_05735, partial [Terriglobales bacterium]|nr:hypothetical protein [Terriglobales bacterium]
MADTMLGQSPAVGSAPKAVAAGPISYDGQNAAVQQQRTQEMLLAGAAVKRGANWFYWIAALSLVNTLAVISGGHFHFLLGLGITEVTAALSPQVRGLAVLIDVLVLGFFVMCGYYAGKGRKWAFLLGMSFYFLDTGITMLGQDWLSFAFHIYALLCIWRGFSRIIAARQDGQV